MRANFSRIWQNFKIILLQEDSIRQRLSKGFSLREKNTAIEEFNPEIIG